MLRRASTLALTLTFALHTAPLIAAPPAAARVAQPQATGAIQDTAQSAGGQTLPNFTVQLRNVANGQLAGTTTSNAAGSFSFTGLNPANYVIEIVNQAGTIVGTSSAVTVTAGATVTVTVTASAAAIGAAATTTAAAAAGVGAGVSTAVVITTVAAVAGIVAVTVAVTQDEASPSQ